MVEQMITAKDLKLILQKPQHFLLKIEVLKDDGKTILDTLKGTVVGGTSSIDSSSSVRRTFPLPSSLLYMTGMMQGLQKTGLSG